MTLSRVQAQSFGPAPNAAAADKRLAAVANLGKVKARLAATDFGQLARAG